ncbi:MAG: DUF4340 domain-containing protein [Pseudomonadales bacterium]|nr:DUF4340 domain-containing protein [Pseudomonadales bacterium]
MMQDKRFLVALILLAVVATGLMLQAPNQGGVEQGETLVLPGLDLDAVSGLELSRGEERVSLVLGPDGWQVEQKASYPADFKNLAEFLLQLSKLRIAERKTAKPENHNRLGVADTGEGAGTSVTLKPGGEQLIVGRTSTSRGSYFRYADDPQVYLADSLLEVSLDALTWLDPVIINVDAETVRQVSIATKSAGYLGAAWDEESAELRLENVPVDRELRYEGIADTLGRLLVNLRLLDVEPYQDGFFIDPTVTRLTLENGDVIEVQTVQSGEEYWLHLGLDGKRDWQYRISEFTYRDLNKTMEDMLQPPEEGSGAQE